MAWWWNARSATATCAAIVATIVATALIGELRLPIPNLGAGGRLGVPVMVLLPLAATITLISGLTKSAFNPEVVAVRRIRHLDAGFIIASALLTAAAGYALTVSGTEPVGWTLGRNFAGYTGMALIALRLGDRNLGAILPAAFAAVVALFGYRSGGTPWTWAWPAGSPSDVSSSCIAATLFLLGTAALVLDGPIRRARTLAGKPPA